jgi:hypothetical protein
MHAVTPYAFTHGLTMSFTAGFSDLGSNPMPCLLFDCLEKANFSFVNLNILNFSTQYPLASFKDSKNVR